MSNVNIQETFQGMSLGEKIILIAGPLLFIDGFLAWYSIDFGSIFGESLGSVSRNGWQSPGAIWSILAVLIGLAMTGLVAAVRFGNVKLPEMPQGVTWGRLLLGMGVATVLLVVIKFLNESSYLAYGFYIGIILVIALAVGGFLAFQDEQKGGTTTNTPM
ncbi:MAG TPA: hypothetical protein VMR52_00565 [Dehalococcoidia bacterium]|nr:hypothetical protein [Dehalococcoidia bacterium]